MLRYEQSLPRQLSDGAPVFVLLHGRGSDRQDLIGLQPHLLPEAIVVTPEAPFPGTPWGYGPGWAWYRFLGSSRPEPESFGESLELLHRFLAELSARLPVKPGPIILGGFSQGGTMSLAYALSHPGAVPYVINFSGFLADHPSVQATPNSVRGTRIFWGHGSQDPAIPFALAVEGRAALRQAGADLTARDYPMGHGIVEAELQDVVSWLKEPRPVG